MNQSGSSQARGWALAALAAGGAVIMSTAFREPQTDHTTAMPHASGHHLMASMQTQAPFDQLFIDMMVPHHLGAVEMARVAQGRAEHAEILSLADDILRSQNSEIDQMRAWRQAWYGSGETPPTTAMPMLHEMNGQVMSMGTMNMAEDVEQLRNAPEPFDRAFIDAMIPHHQSAIDAAQIAQRQAVRQEIKDLATAIVSAQQREIEQMQNWRLSWYGAAASPTVLPDAPMHMPGMGH
jgi:uncharacterized protein (DUF305 family)